jgi:hypothetical protein
MKLTVLERAQMDFHPFANLFPSTARNFTISLPISASTDGMRQLSSMKARY